MFPAAMRSVIAGGEMTKATMLAQGMTDIIRSEPFDVLGARYGHVDTGALTVSCPFDEASASPPSSDATLGRWACDLRWAGSLESGRGLPGASGRVRVECVDASGATTACPSSLQRVTVTVSWGEVTSRSVSLVSHVARIR